MQGIALLIWGNTTSLAAWNVAGVLLGVGFCWFMPYVNILVNEHTDPSISAQATSYAFFGNSVGSFIPPYAFAALGAITGITSPWKSMNMVPHSWSCASCSSWHSWRRKRRRLQQLLPDGNSCTATCILKNGENNND